MARQNESPAPSGDRAPQNAQLGGFERSENTQPDANLQRLEHARQLERHAIEKAREALTLDGALAHQQAALAKHYAARAMAMMLGAASRKAARHG